MCIFVFAGQLHNVDADLLGWWLCERQLPSGGLNGRPEKLPDVCYSWWVLASLCILGRLHWIHREALVTFVLACQDPETGGFSDRPGDLPDPFHTVFGLAALSLMGDPAIKPVNPTYCMPQHVIDRLGLRPQKLSLWTVPFLFIIEVLDFSQYFLYQSSRGVIENYNNRVWFDRCLRMIYSVPCTKCFSVDHLNRTS